MGLGYISRKLEEKIKKYLVQFPAVVLTGARQTGKSTLLKHMFGSDSRWDYVNLDQRGALEKIKSDPDLFARDIAMNIVIDEAQKCPELFHSIKWRVDEGMKHKIILSGSANFHLLEEVTETLAGRAGVLELFTLSLAEKYTGDNILELLLSSKNSQDALDRIRKCRTIKDDLIFNHILWGGYPKILEYKKSDFKLNWFENYRTTYLEKDVRDMAHIAELGDFQRFYQMLAYQVANILNLSNIASDIGITVPTCKKYLQILEASYQYFLLRSYHINVRKRLIHSPKVFIWDTGLGNYFIGNSSLKELKNSGRLGAIFENFVTSELMKQNSLLTKKCNLYFWRTSNGAEVDLVIERGNTVLPVEIKSNLNISSTAIKGLTSFMKMVKPIKKIPFGAVFYRGDKVCRLAEDILAIPAGCL